MACQRGVDRGPPCAESLPGNAVNQVETHIVDPRLTQQRDGACRLTAVVASSQQMQLAVDETLRAHAHTSHPHGSQRCGQRGIAHIVGVDLDGELFNLGPVKLRAQSLGKAHQLLGTKHRRRAATYIDRGQRLALQLDGAQSGLGSDGLDVARHLVNARG